MTYQFPYVGSDKKLNVKATRQPLNIPRCSDLLKNILLDVCAKHGVHPNDVVSQSRIEKYVFIRQEFILRCREETQASFPRIGHVLNRDHSTIVYHYHCAKARQTFEPLTKEQLQSFVDETSPLTPRQHAVKELMSKGYRNYEIGAALGVSNAVVKNEKRIIRRYCPTLMKE